MKVFQNHFFNNQWVVEQSVPNMCQLVLAFGSRKLMLNDEFYSGLKAKFPVAEILGCTTSGEILGDEVYDESLVVTGLEFSDTAVEVISGNISSFHRSFDAGLALADLLTKPELKYVMVISDGQMVNGTELVDGISQSLPEDVLVTGGMAGDADRFKETIVWHNEKSEAGKIVLCGFYGDSIRVGHGTLGGWDTFGPERQITKSDGNVLVELDSKPALALYKDYLGEYSKQLPSSALRFPLSLKLPGEKESVVRTILSINENDNTMVFAGDMPEGASAKLMKANFDALIDGADGAAKEALSAMIDSNPQVALLVSCVGRRLVLSQRVFEELEAVKEVFGEEVPTCGFYSYGEISPLIESVQCRLHNQTMTITTISEVNDA